MACRLAWCREVIATIRANYPAVRGIVEDVVRLNMRRLVKTPVLVGSPIFSP
jgi:hypothetical protein